MLENGFMLRSNVQRFLTGLDDRMEVLSLVGEACFKVSREEIFGYDVDCEDETIFSNGNNIPPELGTLSSLIITSLLPGAGVQGAVD